MPATADLRTRQSPSNHELRVQEDEDAQRLKVFIVYLSMRGTVARLNSCGIQHLL